MENTGLNTADVQYAICHGTYGGNTHSQAEKQAACERYEQLTGAQVENIPRLEQFITPLLLILFVLGIILVTNLLKKRFKNT